MSKKKPTYEDKVEELEAILRRLDDPDTPIDTLAEDVKKGAALIRELDNKLREVESQVRDAFAELESDDEDEEDEEEEDDEDLD